MAVPAAVVARLRAKYPRPQLDPEWLQACYEYVTSTNDLNGGQIDAIVAEVEAQLLQSDLSDSTIRNTGFPSNVGQLHSVRIAGGREGPVLCQITSIMEIGHSAFSLQNVRQTRIDRADLAGLIEAGVEDEEENEAIPPYPRSTLRFEISDGSVVMTAIEYRRLPSLQLGGTPLGQKLLLKNVLVRGGVAFLEPLNVTVIENTQTEELEADQDSNFAKGLKRRLGQVEEEGVGPGMSGTTAAGTAPIAPAQVAPARGDQRQDQRQDPVDEEDEFDYFGDDTLDEEYLQRLAEVERQHVAEAQSQRENGAHESDLDTQRTAVERGNGRIHEVEIIELSD